MKTHDTFRLDGRFALVTGAARGIGQAIAIGLAEAGAEIAVLDRIPCGETLSHIETMGRRAAEIECDLEGLNAARADAIINETVTRMDGLDILVNAAGIIRRAPALEMPEDDWRQVIDINLSAVFYLSQAAARYFSGAGRRGKILNVASMLSFQGGMLTASYAAAKSGLAGLTRALANEWAPLGISVNAIAPGYIATDLTAGLRNDPDRNGQIVSRIPAGRWGEPDDVTGAAVFLTSHASDYVHGIVLPVDGGWLTR